VTLITALPVGSGPDAVLRLLANKLSALWQQSVVVDNRPGGAGFIAIDAAKRQPADGHTLLQLDSEHLSALPYLYPARHFETLKTFEPVAPMFRTPFMVAVAASSPYKSMDDLLAAARAKPAAVTYGSWAVGSPAHLGGEWLESLTSVQMSHIPFKEISQLYSSVATSEVTWAFASVPSSQGLYKSGKLRYLAVAANQRIPQMPHVPTMAESGGPAALEVNSFVSLLSPKGLNSELRSRIHDDVIKALATPEIRERFEAFAYEPLNWSIDEILKNADAKSRQYRALIQKANINLD
jgi:tripartite-type tricarboxylate transporter receptor subunit TctC